MCILFTQLFVLMVDYKESWFHVAYGWLPKKETLNPIIPYYIFLIHFLDKFYFSLRSSHSMEKTNTNFKGLKLDLKIAMHKSLDPLFKIDNPLLTFWYILSLLTNSGCMFGQAIQRKESSASWTCQGLTFAMSPSQILWDFVLSHYWLKWGKLESFMFINITTLSLFKMIEKLKLQFWLTSAELSWMALSIQTIITSCFCLVFNINPILIQKWLRIKNLTNSWR